MCLGRSDGGLVGVGYTRWEKMGRWVWERCLGSVGFVNTYMEAGREDAGFSLADKTPVIVDLGSRELTSSCLNVLEGVIEGEKCSGIDVQRIWVVHAHCGLFLLGRWCCCVGRCNSGGACGD